MTNQHSIALVSTIDEENNLLKKYRHAKPNQIKRQSIFVKVKEENVFASILSLIF
jgi:hypothetical protein